MIEKSSPVKSKKIEGDVVCTYNEYETIEEALDVMGNDDVLETLNSMVKTRAMNAKRAELTGGGKVTQKQITAAVMNCSTDQLVELQNGLAARDSAADSGDNEAIDSADNALRDIITSITG